MTFAKYGVYVAFHLNFIFQPTTFKSLDQTPILCRGSTLPLFLDAIGNFKLSSCQCYREEDRKILHNKVGVGLKIWDGI